MSDYHFFIQYRSMGSSSRGIQSGGHILTPKELLDKEFFENLTENYQKASLLYADGSKMLVNAKSMPLSEFMEIFPDASYDDISHLVNTDARESWFRKEIALHYMPKETVPHYRCTSKYRSGSVFIPKDGKHPVIYLGNFHSLEIYVDGRKRMSLSGHLYCDKEYCGKEEADSLKNLMYVAVFYPKAFKHMFTKGKKYAVEKSLEQADDLLGHELEGTRGCVLPGYGNSQYDVAMEFRRSWQ